MKSFTYALGLMVVGWASPALGEEDVWEEPPPPDTPPAEKDVFAEWPSATTSPIAAEPDFSDIRSEPITETGRFRFGYDLGFTAGAGSFGECDDCGSDATDVRLVTAAFGVDMGYQFTRNWAVFARLEGGSIWVASYFGGYGIVEFSPARVLSLGLGFGLEGGHTEWTNEPTGRGYMDWAIPIQIHFNLWGNEEWTKNGRTKGWRLGLEAVPVFGDISGAKYFRAGLNFGYSYM